MTLSTMSQSAEARNATNPRTPNTTVESRNVSADSSGCSAPEGVFVGRHPRGHCHRGAAGARGANVADMAGAIVFVVVMVLAVPIGVMLGGAVWSALFGFFAVSDANQRAVGTPYEVVSDPDA